jgi:hypothetical protein
MTVDVPSDRKVVLTLPPDTPTGSLDLAITISERNGTPKRPRTSLADWAEGNAEDWGDEIRSDDIEGFTGRRF